MQTHPVTPTVLLLPGWNNSGPDHWQSVWQGMYGYARVEQHDWDTPLRGDWMAQLEEAVLRSQSCILVAHSLACHLVAAWAAHSSNTQGVKAALLVAPADIEQADMQHVLHSWRPIVRQRLPFPSVVVASANDPYCHLDRAQDFAHAWGARPVNAGMCGHINAEAQLGEWPAGHALLQDLLNKES